MKKIIPLLFIVFACSKEDSVTEKEEEKCSVIKSMILLPMGWKFHLENG